MKIFPAIDIKDKKCVRLIKGDFENKTEYETSPVDQAAKYKDHGFKNLHIVDLDGALTGKTVNLEIINEIVSKMEMFMEKDVLFIKNMTHHLAKTNVNFSRNWYHIILTRSPQSAYISFKKVISNPTVLDLGYKEQYAIALKFKKKNIPFYILSSEELLNSPKKELENLCDYLKINFDNNMLSWDRGGIKEDGIWAKYWYENVHKSQGFKPNKKMDGSKRIENDTITISSKFYHKLLALKK